MQQIAIGYSVAHRNELCRKLYQYW